MSRRRARREREALEIIEWARRAIKAAGRRTEDADEFELAELVSLRADLEEAIHKAVSAQHARVQSWAYIGSALGITRQSAQARYANKMSA